LSHIPFFCKRSSYLGQKISKAIERYIEAAKKQLEEIYDETIAIVEAKLQPLQQQQPLLGLQHQQTLQQLQRLKQQEQQLKLQEQLQPPKINTKRKRFSESDVQILKNWFKTSIIVYGNAYASRDEHCYLSRITDLEQIQVSTWFQDYRNKLRKQIKEGKDVGQSFGVTNAQLEVTLCRKTGGNNMDQLKTLNKRSLII